MFKFKDNKYFIAGFAILMAVGLMAAYIPMLFPQVPAGSADSASGDVSGNISGAAQLNQNAPVTGAAVQTATSTAISTDKSANLPASLNGLQNDLNDLNSIQDSLSGN